jgi:hypothetical protein
MLLFFSVAAAHAGMLLLQLELLPCHTHLLCKGPSHKGEVMW